MDLDALAGVPPLGENGIRIGLVATFARWKGHETFLRAMRSVFERYDTARGYVVGGPIYETEASQFSLAELKATAARLGIEDRIAFAGLVDDVPAAMRALDIVVHASTEPEPFGLAIAEAMACARPVVASSGGGAEEIALAGAVFHQPGNNDDLAARINELAASPARRATLGRAGRAAAEHLFSRARMADVLVPFYESLTANRPG
jgi:glycosyltransferase involved in cell wall biosynthesis